VVARARSSGARRSGIPDPAPLLLAASLPPATVAELLAPYGFADLKRADGNIQSLAGEPRSRERLARLLSALLAAVAETADPDQALNHWERFLHAGVNRAQLFDYLAESPRMLALLCRIFGNSDAMAQTLIRDPLLVYWLAEERVLTRGPSRPALERALRTILENVSAVELKLDALRRFRRREMLRIGVRDLLRLADVRETTTALSELACVLIQAAYEVVAAGLRRLYGTPMCRDDRGRLVESGFAVIAMGKLGGGELNFSSDVDLLYVSGPEEGETRPWPSAHARSIPNEEYFEYLARALTRALADISQEGYVFRVDLRLRPEGSVGRLARSVAGYADYYRTRGQGWERLACLKAWPVAGSLPVGRAFLQAVKPFVFGSRARAVDPGSAAELIKDVKAIKEMIDDKMANRGQERRNVKLGTGGIREIEFIVQAVQVLYGAWLPGIRDRGTLGALARFKRHGLLSARDHTALVQAYLFLRDVEHKLQMVHDLQTHALPGAPEELTRCAIRLGYSPGGRQRAMSRFVADHRRHTAKVNRIFRMVFEAPARSRILKVAARLQRRNSRQPSGH